MFQKQVRFCPKSGHKTPQTFHKQPFNMDPCKHKQNTHILTQAATQENNEKKVRPTSVVWHSFAQSLSSPSQTSHTSPPAPGQTVYASQ